MKKHKVAVSASLLVLSLLSSLTVAHPTFNIGYVLWKNDLFRTSETNKKIFFHDYPYHQELVGRPLDELKKKFPGLNDGSTFPEGSYRKQSLIDQTQEEGLSYFWFDYESDSFGWCIQVKDNTIQRFILAKG
ncbi:MAG: hypothetical protein ACSHX8_15020 [Opitutaceae bacterium]